jgi:DNA polymerase-3 subunit gamma/tau
MEFSFRRISQAEIVARLKFVLEDKGVTGLEDELLDEIAERAEGGMRDALMTLDQITRVGVKTVDQFHTLMGIEDFAPDLFEAVIAGDLGQAFARTDAVLQGMGDPQSVIVGLIRLVADLFKIQAGGQPSATAGLEARTELAMKVPTTQLLAAAKVLWDLKTKVRAADDQRSTVELALVMMVEAMRPPEAVKRNESKPVTLDQLKSMAEA